MKCQYCKSNIEKYLMIKHKRENHKSNFLKEILISIPYEKDFNHSLYDLIRKNPIEYKAILESVLDGTSQVRNYQKLRLVL